MSLRLCLVIGALVASARSTVAAPICRVLGDRLLDDQRTVAFVVEDGASCVPVARVIVAPPYTATTPTRCALVVAGPRDAIPTVTLDGQPLALPLPAITIEAAPIPDPAKAPPKAWSLAIVATRERVPVGHQAVAAYLVVLKDGAPTSDVDLNVSVEGARPRALRWTARGVAAIDLFVATWRPTVEVVAQRGEADQVRATVEVDPGSPIDVALAIPRAIAGQELVPTATVRTSEGVPIPPERVRVAIDGCVAAGRGFTCPVGEATATVAIEHDGTWIPIDRQAFVVGEAPAPLPIAVAAPSLAWELGLRGGRTLDGWSGGPRLGAVHPIAARLDLELGLAWRHHRRALAGQLPLAAVASTLAENELALLGGLRHAPSRSLPLLVRAMLGVAGVRTSLDGEASGDLGLRAFAGASVGARVPSHGVVLGVDLAVRRSFDLVVAGFGMAASELYLEVSVAR